MLASSIIACNLAASTNFSSSFICLSFSILIISLSSCSASNFLFSKPKLDTDSFSVFNSSIRSLSSAKSFASCSDLKPSIVASTAITSFLAVINAISFSKLPFLANATSAAFKTMFAFSSITVFCSSSNLPSFSFAAILSVIEFLSSSLICLCCSACLSYFSSKPAFITSAFSAAFAS